jgi:nucleoid-associated protein YgaU
MTRSQVTALLLGAGVLALGLILAWRGVLPGWPTSQPPPISRTAVTPEKPATPPAVPASGQAASPQVTPAQPQQQAAIEPNTPAQPAAPGPDIPGFDTLRVEPSGDTVVAGHAGPNTKVELIAGDKVIAEADADGAGNFVIVPPALAPGSYVLALRSTSENGTVIDSHQNVAVSVPPKGQTNVVVALAEPGKPSVVLTDTNKPAQPMTAPQASAAPAQPEVAFKTAEVDNGGFYASGTATPGAHLRIYLNGTALAEVTAGPDRHWSLTVQKGMAPGHFAVRADVIDATGKVLARAEVPFDVPVSVAEADTPSTQPSAAPMVAAPAQPAATPAAPAQPATRAAPAQPAPGQSAAPSQSASALAAPTPQASASSEPAQSENMAPREPGAGAPAPAAEPNAAPTTEEATAASPSSTPSPNDVVVPQIQTTTVVRGDSLWRISRKIFGHGIRYTLIYEANADQIRDPSLIYPGQIFVLPHATN